MIKRVNKIETEFERQVTNFLIRGYPKLAGLSEEEFTNRILPLKNKLNGQDYSEPDVKNGNLSFVIVVKSTLVPTETAFAKVQREGKPGVTKLFPHTPEDFSVIKEIELPESDCYLLIDIDRGKETINIKPEEAFLTIKREGRSPLTIDEGTAILTHYPEFLIKNNCFSLLASRHPEDKRVPAIWINSKKEPNLGWCWNGNPHTWLGSASCATRIS